MEVWYPVFQWPSYIFNCRPIVVPTVALFIGYEVFIIMNYVVIQRTNQVDFPPLKTQTRHARLSYYVFCFVSSKIEVCLKFEREQDGT